MKLKKDTEHDTILIQHQLLNANPKIYLCHQISIVQYQNQPLEKNK
jgi:hypothetical protein